MTIKPKYRIMNAKEVIKKYLDERAAADPLFAEAYAKKEKSIDKCYWYICDEVKKKRKGNVVCVSDEEVFGMAVHYYDEDDIKVDARLKDDMAVAVEKSEKDELSNADPQLKKLSMAELAEARKKAVEFWKKKIGDDAEEKHEIELAVKREKEAERRKKLAEAKAEKAVSGMGSLFG